MNYTVYIYVNNERCYYCSIYFPDELGIMAFVDGLANDLGVAVDYECD